MPVAPTASNQEFCGSATVGDLLGSVGSGEELLWYADAIHQHQFYQERQSLATGTYYAASRDVTTGCISTTNSGNGND